MSDRTFGVYCLKTLLMMFNFVFWVTGIAVLAVGIWMKVVLHKYISMSDEVSMAVPYVLIAIGALIFVIGSFACCCTVKGQPMLLYLYSAVLFLIFAAMLGAGISGYMFRDEVTSIFEGALNESLHKWYGEAGHEEITKAYDDMQSTLKCCGVNNYTDWFDSPWSNDTETVPQSCCIHDDKCDLGPPVAEKDVFHKGCYKRVVHGVEENVVVIASVAVVIAFIQFLGSLFSCCLARSMHSTQYHIIA